jgi:hypothetical protein
MFRLITAFRQFDSGDLGNTTTWPKFWRGTPQDGVPIEVLGGLNPRGADTNETITNQLAVCETLGLNMCGLTRERRLLQRRASQDNGRFIHAPQDVR